MSTINEDILALIEASLDANYSEVRSVSNRIAKSLSADDMESAKKIKSLVRRKGVPLRSSGYSDSLPTDSKSRIPLLEEHQWPVTPLFLSENEIGIFDHFIDSVKHQDKLIEHGLSGRLSLLLSGPPGTGKTLIAGHIASRLGRPLYVVRLDSVISSLLGDTAKNLRQIFDFVPAKNGIVFLDEVDAVAKLRDDRHEIGELKRVVNTLIQGLDSLDDNAVVIAATNHAALLDPAIWRRFPFKIKFGLPDLDVREALWNHFLYSDNGLEKNVKALSVISEGLTGADIETVALSARRQAIINDTTINIASVINSVINTNQESSGLMTSNCLDIELKKRVLKILNDTKMFTQSELGDFLNLSRQTISSYLKE
ncbi:AAA family ATPase [Pantoea vagans]|uniref:AAA family ATPase n=1 Tax=Pantoea vagans TaxID=470934 RepID=UPI00241E5F51|nr:ATP-binding protein [Pantoea vagans]